MKIIIVGGGATGLTLANLLGDEHEVTVVEKDEETAKDIATKTQALVIQGDGSDVSALNEASIATADAMVATADDKTNLMICEIAKSEKVKKIISLVREPKNEELFAKLGITSLVSVVGTNVTAIKRLLYQIGDVRIIAQLDEGAMQIVEIVVAEDSPLVGKPAELKKATLAAIYRGGELVIPQKDMLLEAGDLLLIVAKTKDLPALTDLITGQ
ncbi:NAD-binding protein [Candidatus Peregrinibacteria bacterium]|nr:NAD-binding protein [Candidatus Peregrinibacteria bacterium]